MTSPNAPEALSYWRLLFDQGAVDQTTFTHRYRGSGTISDPYVIEWPPGDSRNPFNWTLPRKVLITFVLGLTSLSVAFSGSAYMSPEAELGTYFNTTSEMVIMGLFTFNLGQACGPVVWGPLSETLGRQIVFIISFAGVTIFNGACTASQSISVLVAMRFFTGLCASSPLSNAGGVISDMFIPAYRGLAMTSFILSPYLGPAIGPIVCGFVAQYAGWRWVEAFMTIFTGCMGLLGLFVIPETYAPVLLRHRAQRMAHLTGDVYISVIEHEKGKMSIARAFQTALSRPWIFLVREPIVTLLSVYMAIIYGTLYSFFGAFPIVYQETRGWTPGMGGLAFIGVAIGMICGVAAAFYVNIQYRKVAAKGKATPETRLIPAMIGSVLLPISLFWFAWTNYPSISAIVSIAAGVPFGAGMVLVYLALNNYLVDSYTVYAASALAASAFLRCIFGAVFPLFTPAQYDNLGIHWAATIPAFLSLACGPFPFLFSKFGSNIRERCKYSAEAARIRRMLHNNSRSESHPEPVNNEGRDVEANLEAEGEEK
ncbi:MFS general substrate transporter [Penicillium angulare]|uniref:MFS general substrate transporter n=1 Tax=Penicillium angulare TaxID=116970 RepID=A0A9W9GDU5_9EURO|nr:MFS general substrate transporter [Penicillium angulare]